MAPPPTRSEGMLVFATGGQLVQIDVGNSTSDVDIAKRAGEIVTNRLS